MKNTVEKNSQLVLGLLGLFIVITYIVNSFKLGDWSGAIYQATGIALFLLLMIEGGVLVYFQTQRYKSIGWKDVVVWLTAGVAFMVLLNTILTIQLIGDAMPLNVIEFAGTSSGFVGIVAGFMIILQMVTPRIRA